MAPTGQGGQWQDVLCCTLCSKNFDRSTLPISLICGHVICDKCASTPELQEKPCPSDDWKPTVPITDYPTNVAILSISEPSLNVMSYSAAKNYTEQSIDWTLCEIAKFFVKADSERGGLVFSFKLSKTLQRKVFALLCYQWTELDGLVKCLKACKFISERVMMEMLLSIQSNTHVSSQLWTAVRARGCQFLGPAMQEDVLRLILITLENGEMIARKNLVMYVVTTLMPDYPQVSKTCVGHVVQLLYRASCFNVIKREGESSLMQLKDEFRVYEALRREHDSQIVQIAFEAGLRIGPEQWSALLYGDQGHRSHMQSIIDKLQSPNAYGQCLAELQSALEFSTTNMSTKKVITEILPILELFENPCSEKPTTSELCASLKNLVRLLNAHAEHDKRNFNKNSSSTQMETRRFLLSGRNRFKTKMCANIEKSGRCEKGNKCSYAHSYDELRELSANDNRQYQKSNEYKYRKPAAPQNVAASVPQPIQHYYHRPPPPPEAVPLIACPPRPPGAMIIGYPITADGNGAQPPPQPPPPQPSNGAPMVIVPPPAGPAMVMPPPSLVVGAQQPQVTAQPPQQPPPPPAPQPQSQLNAIWAAPSPTGAPANIIFSGTSPPHQPHQFWMHSTMPMESFDYGLIWGPPTTLRDSTIDAEQLLMKRNEILNRLAPPQSVDEDESAEDGGIGHVSYTVASSVLDDSRIEHHPIALLTLKPVQPIDLPAIPVSFAAVPTDETMTMIGEMVQNRPRAASLSQSTAPCSFHNEANATVQSDCSTMSVMDSICQPIATPAIQKAAVTTVTSTFPLAPMATAVAQAPDQYAAAGNAPPPAAAPPLLVDNGTGMLTPVIRPIRMPTYPQDVVSNSLDRIVDVKERLSEAQGNASEAENEHLRMELRMAESEMANLDPFTKKSCLLRELHQVDLELKQLHIEPPASTTQ